MCIEREQLIGFIYDDCDPAERRRIEEHLESCGACRREVSGLRQVRQDLLAWDVPDHGSVWQPFARPRVMPSWRDVPVWAMAAAASLLLLVGAAGGVVTYALLPHAAPATASAAPTSQIVPAAVSRADLAQLEQHVLSTVRSEMDERVRLVTAHAAPSAVPAREVQDLRDQVRQLQTQALATSIAMNGDMARLSSRTINNERRLSDYGQQFAFQNNIQPIAYPSGR